MARQLRKKSGTGIYHVMVRGINRQDIFEDEEDYLQMVSILRALSDRHDEQGLRLPPLSIFYAYCLMSNHLHLLLREQEEEVSDVVKRIGVTYAHYFNKTNWCFVWSNSKVGKMIRRTDPMISLSYLGLSFCKDNKSS